MTIERRIGPEIISRCEMNFHLELPKEVAAEMLAATLARSNGIEHSSRYNPLPDRLMSDDTPVQESVKTDE